MNSAIFKNKNCLITGATGGLGIELAKQLVSFGANIVLAGRSEKKLESLKKSLQEINKESKIEFYVCELNSRSAEELHSGAVALIGEIDILLNSAGVFNPKPLSEESIESVEESFQVNVLSPFFLSQRVAPSMQKKKWGRIVNVGSSSCYGGAANTSAYVSTKHALLGLSRALQKELCDDNIRVFNISPSGMKTEMGARIEGQDYSTFVEPKEVAENICFLISYDEGMIAEEVSLKRMINR